MKILILGADGFYGWPLLNRLAKNHTVLGLDNFWRRHNTDPSLIPLNNRSIEFCDITNIETFEKIISSFLPDVVVHLAEQRSAPYSMKDYYTKVQTIQNNTLSTLNVAEMAKKYKFHIIHIGSMGVYGYTNHIEEGDIARSPGSIYHVSKCMDNNLLEFYSRTYGVSVTELHQGIIWGIGGRFDYDATFGTVINRFIVQKMINEPLTLYGKGLQKRAFIHIENSIDCVELAISNRPIGMETYNQYTEIKTIAEIATIVGGVPKNIKNPRIENEQNQLTSSNQKLLSLGMKPIIISQEEILKIEKQLSSFIKNVDIGLIQPTVQW
tara:strand:- start:4510 stop:5481 length:972 start_codon:yes stop_codon:yes gene_type:complete